MGGGNLVSSSLIENTAHFYVRRFVSVVFAMLMLASFFVATLAGCKHSGGSDPEPITYTVMFIANGGTGDVVTQSFVVGTAQALTANSFSRDSYTFIGWNTKSDGSGTSYIDGASVQDLATVQGAVVTLYAQWEEVITTITYTVSFNANGGTGEMLSQLFTVGAAQELTMNGFTRNGYSFNGWNTKSDGSGISYADRASVQDLATTQGAVVTLYAQWKEIVTAITYTVVFNANGGSGTMDAQDFTVGTAQNLTANTFTREGYTFSGWNTKSDGTGTSYADGVSVQILATAQGSVVTLYAQWEEVITTITYTVLFDANGGTGKMLSQLFTVGAAQELTMNGFTRHGYSFNGWQWCDYTFIGWNTETDGSGTSYADCALVQDLATTQGAVVTLYAQWEDPYLLSWAEITCVSQIDDRYLYTGTSYTYTFTIRNISSVTSPVCSASYSVSQGEVSLTPPVQTVACIPAGQSVSYTCTVQAVSNGGTYLDTAFTLTLREVTSTKLTTYTVPLLFYANKIPVSVSCDGEAVFTMTLPDEEVISQELSAGESTTVYVPNFGDEENIYVSVSSNPGAYYTISPCSETALSVNAPTTAWEITEYYNYGGSNHSLENAYTVSSAFQAYCTSGETDWYAFTPSYTAAIVVTVSQYSDDILLTATQNGSEWVFSTEENAKSYRWAIDGVEQTERTNSFVLETAGLRAGVYEVTVEVEREIDYWHSEWYSASAKVTVGGN